MVCVFLVATSAAASRKAFAFAMDDVVACVELNNMCLAVLEGRDILPQLTDKFVDRLIKTPFYVKMLHFACERESGLRA